jgi:membrane protease YdiL (CAAX protease family)
VALRVVAFALLFLGCVRLGGEALDLLTTDADDLRGRAALAIFGSVLGQAVAAALLTAWLLASGRGLGWAGLTRLGSLRGWVLASAVAATWIVLVWTGILRGVEGATELSLWRASTALAAGLVGGFCEEFVFRGAVIQSLKEARWPVWCQVLGGGVMFGLAHLGWAALGGSLAAGAAAAVFTSILGLGLSAVFLVSGRSLSPPIFAHALINLSIEPWLVLTMLENAGR